MSSNNETEIEKKKSENDQQTNDLANKSTVNYLLTILKTIVFLGILTILGSATLYSTKVAQTNAIPTSYDCKPYTDKIPEYRTAVGDIINSIDVYINVIKDKDSTSAQKIHFNYDEKENNKNAILDYLTSIKNNTDKLTPVKSYFISIVETIILFIYNALNSYLQLIGDNMTESLIIFLTPFISLILFGILFIVSWIYLFCLFFINLPTLFTYYNKNTQKQEFHILSFTTLKGVMFSIIFGIIVIMFGINLSFVSIFLIVYCCLSVLTTSFKPNNGGEKDSYSFRNAIIDVFKYKKLVFSYILTIMTILAAFKNFGSGGGVFCILSVLLIKYNIIPLPLFSSPHMDNTFEPFVKIIKPTKSCGPIETQPPV